MSYNMIYLFLSTQELVVAFLIAVLLFGSKKIPELARGLGKGIREFKNATSDIQEEIRKSASEVKDTIEKDTQDKQPKTDKS